MFQNPDAPPLENVDHHLQLVPTSTINASPRQDAISKLSDDVLFYIFSVNSRMEMMPFNTERTMITEMDYEANTLTTNRHSSQVCRRWRNIMLSSPTIWANSLNIDELNQPKDDWRSEVLERTGNAPISLIGRIGFESSNEGNHATLFVLDILEHEWDRIRYLSICANDPDIEDQMLISLQQPAPNLEYLLYITTRVEDDEEPPSLRVEDGEALFSNISPKLTFVCAKGFSFDFVPSLSNLRQLWLTGFSASFTIPELYLGLQYLPLLEELFINYNELLEEFVGLPDDLPLINLPRLGDITIDNSGTRLITDLIRYIVPAPRCRLVVSSALLDGLDEVELANLSQFYSTFIRNIADFQSVPYISLSHAEEGIFAFRAANGPLQFNSTYPYLSFSFAATSQQDLSVLKAFSVAILKALSARPDLGHITKLDLKLEGATFASSHGEVIAFLRKLESVSELTTDLTMLRILAHVQATAGFLILPSITTVIVADITVTELLFNSPKDYLDPFLKGRMALGIPVRLLNLSKGDFSDDGRWNFLNEFPGLSVVWSRRFFGMEDDEMELSDE